MPCEKYRDAIQEYLDGELSAGEEKELLRHCAECPACAKQLAEMSALKKGVAMAAHEPPAGLRAQLLKDNRRERRFLTRAWRHYPVLTAAACAVIVCGAVLGGAYAAGNSAKSQSAAPVNAFYLENDAEEVTTPALLMPAADGTTAGAATAGTATVTAGGTTAGASTAEASTTADASVLAAQTDPAIASAREEARKILPAYPYTQAVKFVTLVRADSVPEGLPDDMEYTTEDYQGETVDMIRAFVTETQLKTILKKAGLTAEYDCSDPQVLSYVAATAEKGLLIVVMPSGA